MNIELTSSNFREICIGKISENTLYRSSHPIVDYKQDSDIAAKATKAGIRTIINLSDTDDEMKKKAAFAPWYRKLVIKKSAIAVSIRYGIFSKNYREKFKDAIQFMLSHERPYIVHCEAGIDRTGFMTMILGAYMGASLKEIAADHLSSFYEDCERELKYGILFIQNAFCKLNNEIPVTELMTQSIAENYLIHDIGLGENEMKLLKEKLSEPLNPQALHQ